MHILLGICTFLRCYNRASACWVHFTLKQRRGAHVLSLFQVFPGSEGGYFYEYPNSTPCCTCPTCGDQEWPGLAQACGCLAHPFGRGRPRLRGDLALHLDAIGPRSRGCPVTPPRLTSP